MKIAVSKARVFSRASQSAEYLTLRKRRKRTNNPQARKAKQAFEPGGSVFTAGRGAGTPFAGRRQGSAHAAAAAGTEAATAAAEAAAAKAAAGASS